MKKFLSVLMVVAMLFAIALPVAAEISPEPIPEYDVDADVVPEGGGEVEKIENEDGTITLIVKPEDGYNFIKWDIEGEYELVDGKLTDKTITIKPITDVKANAKLEKVTDTKPTPKPNDDEKSPSTGVAPVLCAVAMVVSMAGAGYSFKKSSK